MYGSKYNPSKIIASCQLVPKLSSLLRTHTRHALSSTCLKLCLSVLGMCVDDDCVCVCVCGREPDRAVCVSKCVVYIIR